MYSADEYASAWAKQGKVEQDTLLEWFKAIRSLIKLVIHMLKN